MGQFDRFHIILYVKDQKRSRDFYSGLLELDPILDVPGMTEFEIQANCVLGIMPESGIKRLLGDKILDPQKSNGAPRAELYLTVKHPDSYHRRALQMGAKELSPLAPRDWGQDVAYSLDLDGHVIAFASLPR